MPEKVNLAEKLALFSDHWSPKIIATLNGQEIRLAKILGAFDWHHHAEADEAFLGIAGRFRLEFRDRPAVELGPGELCVVPLGVEHRPVADAEAHILLFEPAHTLNTGNLQNARTHRDLERI